MKDSRTRLGYNLGLIMRPLTGSETPRSWADSHIAFIWLRYPIDQQTVAPFGCPVVIDGSYRGAIIGIELVLLNI